MGFAWEYDDMEKSSFLVALLSLFWKRRDTVYLQIIYLQILYNSLQFIYLNCLFISDSLFRNILLLGTIDIGIENLSNGNDNPLTFLSMIYVIF